MGSVSQPTLTHLSGNQSIDRIVFLAGLASQRSAIDPILDRMREITANLPAGQELPNADQQELESVYTEIKDYLVRSDPLRSFTPESLEERVVGYLRSSAPERRVLNQAGMLVALDTGVAVLFTVLGWLSWREQFFFIGVLPTMITHYAGIAWLFLSSLTTFRAELRRAYIWICAGIMGVGMGAVLWTPYSLLPRVYYMPVFQSGLAIWVIAVSCGLIYIGVRKIGLVLNVKSVAMYPVLVLAITVAASALIAFLPHGQVADAAHLGQVAAGFAATSVVSISIGRLCFTMRRSLTTAYAQAMVWLGAGHICAAVVAVVAIVVLFATGLGPGIKLGLVGGSCGVASVLLFVAGYKFKLSSHDT